MAEKACIRFCRLSVRSTMSLSRGAYFGPGTPELCRYKVIYISFQSFTNGLMPDENMRAEIYAEEEKDGILAS